MPVSGQIIYILSATLCSENKTCGSQVAGSLNTMLLNES